MKTAALILVILTGGFLLPTYLIPDGTERFEGEDRARAELAVLSQRSDLYTDNDPAPEDLIVYLFQRAVRVEEAGYCGHLTRDELEDVFGWPGLTLEESIEEAEAEAGGYPVDTMLPGEWHYKVRLFTLFGIPYDVKEQSCKRA